MEESIVINGIVYLVITADELQQMIGITIDAEVGLVYAGPESGTFTDEVIEVPESVTAEGQTVPVVGFAGGYLVLATGNQLAAASVSEVILPSSILFLMYGFSYFTNLQKVTCYAESVPKLSSEIGGTAGIDFEGTPQTKELYIPAGSDYATWEAETTWVSVNQIYDGFVEIVDGLQYKETSETTVALIGYDETFNSTSITIPSSITHEGNSYTVTEIKNNAFKNYTGLTEVNIPDSVTKISETAFSNITDFETQTISVNNISLNLIGKNTKIDEFVFKNTSGITFTYGDITETSTEYVCECLGLTDTTISTPTLDLTNLIYDNHQLSIYTIKENAFYNCSSLTSIDIPDSVTSIKENAFYNCSSLTSIDIPDSVTSIGVEVFYGCISLTSIDIPNSVTYIGEYAFCDCTSLTSITIPNSVTSIGDGAFCNCSSLTSIDIPDSVTYIGYETFLGCLFTELTFINNSSLDEVSNNYWEAIICDEITDEGLAIQGNVAIRARQNCTSIIIPDNVTEIGEGAFSYCISLISITIPNSVTYIGDWAFDGCFFIETEFINNSSLDEVSNSYWGATMCDEITGDGLYIRENVVIGARQNCTSVIIPDGVTSIGDSAFYGCSLTSITIPNSVTSIGDSAFSYCSLKFIAIPDSVTSIGDYAFYQCGLKSITIPNSVTSIGKSSFKYCISLASVTIPNSVTYIGYEAFQQCSFTSITIPNSVTSIGEYAFCNCSNLTSITIPDSVTSIGYYAFTNCTSLASVTIGNSVTDIGWGTFNKCTSLTSITIPDSVTSIGNEAFRYCVFLRSAFINNSSLDEVANNYWGATICDEITDEGVIIRENVVISVKDNNNYASITIPYGVTSIGSNAFYNCSNSLTSITIPNSVTSIGDWAFNICSKLSSIDIPNSVTSIGEGAFYQCYHLKSVTIGNSCTSIGNYAFYECGLASVTCLAETTPSLGNKNFYGAPSTKKLHVPVGSTGYSTSWSNTTWTNIIYDIVLGEDVNYQLIDSENVRVFNYNNFNNPVIPRTITYNGVAYNVQIDSEYLSDNPYIKALTVSEGIERIADSAFSGFTSMETLSLPDTVVGIGCHACWMCKGLKNVTLPIHLTSLSPEMFVDCDSLETITIPNGVTIIPYRMFESCENLRTVNLPTTITEIQWSAFKDCKNLTTINIPSGCTVDPTAFEGCPNIKL